MSCLGGRRGGSGSVPYPGVASVTRFGDFTEGDPVVKLLQITMNQLKFLQSDALGIRRALCGWS